MVAEERESLIIDLRNEEERLIELVELKLGSLKLTKIDYQISWWDQMIGVVDHKIHFIHYSDSKDPSKNEFHTVHVDSLEVSEVDNQEEFKKTVHEPFVYEHGSEHFQTVADFLSLDLPLSCEYLERDNKIIISYYLRSENGFDRFLLLLEDGKKCFKVHQDAEMKGFSPGSFFEWNNTLIFVKNRNEVCTYPL